MSFKVRAHAEDLDVVIDDYRLSLIKSDLSQFSTCRISEQHDGCIGSMYQRMVTVQKPHRHDKRAHLLLLYRVYCVVGDHCKGYRPVCREAFIRSSVYLICLKETEPVRAPHHTHLLLVVVPRASDTFNFKGWPGGRATSNAVFGLPSSCKLFGFKGGSASTASVGKGCDLATNQMVCYGNQR